LYFSYNTLPLFEFGFLVEPRRQESAAPKITFCEAVKEAEALTPRLFTGNVLLSERKYLINQPGGTKTVYCQDTPFIGLFECSFHINRKIDF
jgi:hypothetical protein